MFHRCLSVHGGGAGGSGYPWSHVLSGRGVGISGPSCLLGVGIPGDLEWVCWSQVPCEESGRVCLRGVGTNPCY